MRYSEFLLKFPERNSRIPGRRNKGAERSRTLITVFSDFVICLPCNYCTLKRDYRRLIDSTININGLRGYIAILHVP